MGLESRPPLLMLTAAEEELVEDESVDGVVLDAIEEAEMLKVELLVGEFVAIAELLEGFEAVEDDSLTEVVTDKLDPVANFPQLLPA